MHILLSILSGRSVVQWFSGSLSSTSGATSTSAARRTMSGPARIRRLRGGCGCTADAGQQVDFRTPTTLEPLTSPWPSMAPCRKRNKRSGRSLHASLLCRFHLVSSSSSSPSSR